MNQFHIRVAKASDARSLAAIYRHYVENTAVSYECVAPDEEEFQRRITATLQKYPYYVAEDESGIIGYAYAGAFNVRAAADWTAEASIYVRLDCKRRGIGKALYAALEETLIRQHIQKAAVKIACCDRADEYLSPDSVIFHTGCGYKQVGVVQRCGYKFGRWYGLMFMEKELGPQLEQVPPIIPFSQL